jgi:hypothetical protein
MDATMGRPGDRRSYWIGDLPFNGAAVEDEIELEDQRRLQEIANAPDWPTTSRLMNERDTWWKQHRRWVSDTAGWVPIQAPDSEGRAHTNNPGQIILP